MKRPLILVVEDEIEVGKLIGYFLKILGYDCAHAENGLVALEALKAQQVDAIISDQEMPHMTGAELFATVRQCWPHLASRFMVITGYQVHSSLLECPALLKPFTFEEFETKIRAMLPLSKDAAT